MQVVERQITMERREKEVIVKKIDAKILKEAVFNPLHPDIILFSRHFLRCWQG